LKSGQFHHQHGIIFCFGLVAFALGDEDEGRHDDGIPHQDDGRVAILEHQGQEIVGALFGQESQPVLSHASSQKDEEGDQSVDHLAADGALHGDSGVFPEDLVGFGRPFDSDGLPLDGQLAHRDARRAKELKYALSASRLVYEEIFGGLVFENNDGNLRGLGRYGQIFRFELIQSVIFDVFDPFISIFLFCIAVLSQGVREEDFIYLQVVGFPQLLLVQIIFLCFNHSSDIFFCYFLRESSEDDCVVAGAVDDFIAFLL
jgi:hypothetical protein